MRSRESAPEPKRRGQVSCGHAMSFEEWAAAGLDAGTTVKDSAALSADQIVQFGVDAITKK